MTPARRAYLEANPTAQLTDAERLEGWRFCAERDGKLAHVEELKDCTDCACMKGDPPVPSMNQGLQHG